MSRPNRFEDGNPLQDVYVELRDTHTKNGSDANWDQFVSGNKNRKRSKVANKYKTMEKQNVQKSPGFRTVLKDFAEGSTFHGLRYVAHQGSFIGRKLLWLMMICACTSVLVYQIVDRVGYYYGWPVTVNVRVNYNTSLQFPSITICNQNAFKASISNQLNRYRLLESMYTHPDTFNENDLARFNDQNLTLEDLFLQSAHQKEDFITRCFWKGLPCTTADFNTTLTDHGVCYTFNEGRNQEYISSVGVENGLRLTLNVEQYEYMPGPHDAAGVKMLLHANGEVPRVHALGQAVSTGAHVFVGVKVFRISNLPRPHGSCREHTLEYVDTFSMDACQMDCLTSLAKLRCGCRHAYMLHKNGDPPVCTLYEYFKCLKPLIDEFPSIHDTLCDCPVPCNFIIYEPDISYASTSQYAVNKFLSNNDKAVLSAELLKATEVTSRMENSTFQRTVTLAKNLEKTLNDVEHLVLDNLSTMIDDLSMMVNDSYSETFEIYSNKEFLYRFQEYIVKKNFIRARDAMEERVIHIVALAYAEYILTIESRIRMMANENFTDHSARLMMHETTTLMLQNRKAIVNLAFDNYSTLINAYDMGAPIFNYSFEGLGRHFNRPATPRHLIMEARVHNSYAVKYGQKYGLYLNKTIERLEWLQELSDVAFYNSTLDEDRMFYCREEFKYYMRNFVFARSVFYFDTIEWPIGVLQKRLEYFNSIWSQYSTLMENILQSLKSLELELDKTDALFLNPLNNVLWDISQYIHEENATKMAIVELLTSQGIQDGMTEFKMFFQNVRVRETNLIDWVNRLEEDVLEMWKIVVDDIDSMEYYEYLNESRLLRNFSDVAIEIRSAFSEIRNMCQMSQIVDNKDALFLDALEAFIVDARAFKESIIIDSDFIKNNFLQLDIFYRQMSYEEINQQEAYDIFALLCDIGGSMGLFLGASVLSIVEVWDLILVQILAKTRRMMSISASSEKR
ncbi:Acid-sensing ion channel 1 [Mizuhopecten yessoensis]|uniref:Acid-sensing ion channel 1 n=2 Tax=Mizuhopecten yessoensis TaxID=6573 RepID=A0A210Q0T5_MIZYE|nr:Acid-sensing ion channel 1 [Mizuhopecten yessoensis]